MEGREREIMILGAGIGGLRVALRLEKRLKRGMGRIILIDQNDYHQYLYRIHEVCGPDYDERDIIVPLSKVIGGKRIEFRKMRVERIDAHRRVVVTSEGEMPFDILVIALGSSPQYYGIEGLEENSLVLNSYEAAREIRRRIEELFREAGRGETPPRIVVAGGGFTGTELAGELAEWIPMLIERYGLRRPDSLLTLVEAMPHILPGWNPELSEMAEEILASKSVEIVTGDPVKRALREGLELKSGRMIHSDLTIWTGGVTCNRAVGGDFEMVKGRIRIDDYCHAWGYEDIYVVGDASCALDGETGKPLPPSAHIAMAQADVVSHNIYASLTGGKMRRYIGERVGEIVTLGRRHAIGELWGLRMKGLTARVMKKLIHLWYVHSIGGVKLLLGDP